MTKALWFAIALGAGCTSGIDGPIEHDVMGGFSGTGDGTHLRIEVDGSATLVTMTGQRTFQIDADALASLHRAIYDAHLDADVTVPGCCDTFEDVVRVPIDGDVRTLTIDQGAQSVPAALANIVAKIHALE